MAFGFQGAESAKQFLFSKLLNQAALDSITLSDIEQRMFLFSETSQNPPDFEPSTKFDDEYDGEAYESKVSELLRRAYANDQKLAQEASLWKENLAALKDVDFYGLVMVDQAGIDRPEPRFW